LPEVGPVEVGVERGRGGQGPAFDTAVALGTVGRDVEVILPATELTGGKSPPGR
jgi:hypothetical protein